MSYQCPRPCENKTEYGYCKTIYCINPQFSNLGTWQQTILQHGTQKLKPQTNANKIRSMTDEELAEFMCGCPPTLRGSEECWGRFGCNRCWLDWLKEEADK